MTVEETITHTGNPPTGCSVVILHETADALTRATALCEQIMAQCWEEQDIQLAHWSMDALTEDTTSEEAATRAAVADILVVAASARGDFPREFALWTERWLARRERHEGTLVGLLEPRAEQAGNISSRDVHLHQLAVRAGLDYLNHLPQSPAHGIPDLETWCASRAETFTGTLEEIIRTVPKPLGE